MKSSFLTGLLLAALAGLPSPAFAAQTKEEIEDIGFAAPAGASSDYKTDAKSAPPPEPAKPFRINIGTRAQYTSNAKLTGDHSSNDVIFFPTIEAGFNTRLGQQFSFDSALRLESGVYGDNTNRSFIGYSLQNTFDFRPKPNLPRVFIGFEPYRYDRFEQERVITEALALSAGSDYGYAFNNGNSMVFVGYTFSQHFANPTMDSRRTNTALAGLSHSFTPSLTGHLFYQFEYSNFYDVDRDDARHAVGLSLTYQLTRHLFTTLTGNFVDNNSSDERASYQSAGASLGFNLQY